jgi:hypothetical protein
MRSVTYFVEGINGEIISNVSREKAIEVAKKAYDNGDTTVGIGRVKYSQKRKQYVYTLLPLYFYID